MTPNTMFCSGCGTRQPGDARFCARCGRPRETDSLAPALDGLVEGDTNESEVLIDRSGVTRVSSLDDTYELKPAPHARRFGAFLLDAVVVYVLGLCGGFVWGLLQGLHVITGSGVPRELGYVVGGGYAVVCWGLLGTSFGKYLFGLKLVVADTGRRVTGLSGMARALVRFVVMVVLAPLWITWWSTLARQDRRALHDLAAGTQLVWDPTRGVRLALRGVRWVLIPAGGLVLVAGGIWALIAWSDVSGVSTATQQSLKSAVLDYDRLDEEATAALDASILQSRATSDLVARVQTGFDKSKQKGYTETSHLVSAQFKAFRKVGQTYEVDDVETWQNEFRASNGAVFRTQEAEPQTAVLVQDKNVWKLSDVRFYTVATAPFATGLTPGPTPTIEVVQPASNPSSNGVPAGSSSQLFVYV
ncbi:MAG TPA: RDD family protein, partial [Chloroflexota bacterium]|nr:RDD family protein [Chloroflexota bacterium]